MAELKAIISGLTEETASVDYDADRVMFWDASEDALNGVEFRTIFNMIDALVYKGVIDCSANPNYPAADAGHVYKVSVAGKIGGGSGPNVEAGDTLICAADSTASGTHAGVGASWSIIQTNVDDPVGRTATQTLTNKTLTSPVINTPTGIVKGDVGLGNVDNTSDATKNSATATLTNKRITAREATEASNATPTPNADTTDIHTITALAAAAAFAVPSGTPTQGQSLMIRIKDNGTARALSYNAIYRAIGVTLPTTTVISKTLYLGMIYNSTDTKWDVIGVAQEA